MIMIMIMILFSRYCNSRVAVFSPSGQHLHDITGDWNVVHSIVLYEAEDVLCVADREGLKVDCLGAGLRLPQFRGSLSSSIRDLGRVYGLAGRGSAMVAVGLGGDWATRGSAQVTFNLQNVEIEKIVFICPSDIAVVVCNYFVHDLINFKCFHSSPLLSDPKQIPPCFPISDLMLAGPDSGPGE